MKIEQFPCMNGRPCTIAHKSMEMKAGVDYKSFYIVDKYFRQIRSSELLRFKSRISPSICVLTTIFIYIYNIYKILNFFGKRQNRYLP